MEVIPINGLVKRAQAVIVLYLYELSVEFFLFFSAAAILN